MKKYFIGNAIAIALCILVLCSFAVHENPEAPEASAYGMQIPATVSQTKGKVLVAYFSMPETKSVDATTGASQQASNNRPQMNTKEVATVISNATGGDLFEIKTVQPYTATTKQDSEARPALSTHIKNLKEYDVVFVGFPNQKQGMPQPLYTFFDEYDFSGKTVIPFCTNGSSHFSDAIKTIRDMEKNATLLDSYRPGSSKNGIQKWLKKIGMTK